MVRGFANAVSFVTVCALAGAAAAPAAAQSTGQSVIGLVQNANTLVRFTTAAPNTVSAPLAVTGLAAGDTLRAIDYRPANGLLYGIATDVSNANVRTYTIDTDTGAATALGGPVTAPTPGTAWDISVNPVVDRIRVVNDQLENLRLVPDSGSLAADDTNLSPGTVSIDAIAYTNPVAGAASTTLYALDQSTNSLATIGGLNGQPSPNGGVVTPVGPLGITFAGSTTAFDIASNNVAYAVLRPAGGVLSIYTVSLGAGTATFVGVVGDGSLALDDIAIVDPGLVLSPPSGTYTSQQSFDIVLLLDFGTRTLTNGTITFDGIPVTSVIASCARIGTGASGVVSLRCPGIGGPVTGPGLHTFVVRLEANDGTVVQRTVTWNVIAVNEP